MATLNIDINIGDRNWANSPAAMLRGLADRFEKDGLPTERIYLIRDVDGEVAGQAAIIDTPTQPATTDDSEPASKIHRRPTKQLKDMKIDEAYFDGARLHEITYAGMRAVFVRFEQGTMPVNTLRAEAHVDVAADDRILGMTIEIAS